MIFGFMKGYKLNKFVYQTNFYYTTILWIIHKTFFLLQIESTFIYINLKIKQFNFNINLELILKLNCKNLL